MKPCNAEEVGHAGESHRADEEPGSTKNRPLLRKECDRAIHVWEDVIQSGDPRMGDILMRCRELAPLDTPMLILAGIARLPARKMVARVDSLCG